MLAALGKSAQLPFSFWLSRAMDGPSPVSALLHSATMVAAGAYLLLRLEPLLAVTAWAATLVAWVGALTALLLGAVAVVQRDLKQLLAASTCAQVGFMVLAAGVNTVASLFYYLRWVVPAVRGEATDTSDIRTSAARVAYALAVVSSAGGVLSGAVLPMFDGSLLR